MIKGTKEELNVLKGVCIAYKSSPYLTTRQKNKLINKAINKFEVF